MEPAALAKAQSLHRFASDMGAPLTTFELVLTQAEGLELIDWLVEQNPPNELLSADVAHAHQVRDPWPVLNNFVLLGFHMTPAAALN
jgi:hypothetical protein